MCGIAGFYIKNPTSKKIPPQDVIEEFVNSLLRGIEPRGKDATGLFSASTTDLQVCRLEKEDVPASAFIYWRDPLISNPRYTLCHTRFATKGDPKKEVNNHPVQYDSVYVTHNGVIRNDDSLFREFDLERHGEVDTEIIPALISKFGLDKVHKALTKLSGGFAIAATDPKNKPGELVLAKGPTNPLEVLETKSVVVWASTRNTIIEAWKHVFGSEPAKSLFTSLHDGELLYLTPDSSKSETMKFEVHRYKSTSYGQNGYSDFSNSGWSGPTYMERQKFCICGHKRDRHIGSQYDGKCDHTTWKSGVAETCDCEKYMLSSLQERHEQVDKLINIPKHIEDGRAARTVTVRRNGVTIDWVTCYECRGLFDKGEMVVDLKSRFYVCTNCCTNSAPESTLQLKDLVATPVTEELDDDDDLNLIGLSTDEWTDLEAEIGKRLGLKPEFVHFVMIEADVNDDEADDSIVNSYILCEDTKQDILRERQEAASAKTAEIKPSEDTPAAGRSLILYRNALEDTELSEYADAYGSCGVQAFEDEDVVH